MARTGKVIISKGINLDNTYSNVLNYTENDMLTLMTSSEHLMYQNETYSFIREQDNQIDVEVPYATCLQSNYIAFQNPNYSNKWFFAFIKDVKFTSEKNTTISYEIDVFTTWFKTLSVKTCFVEREHVNDDTPGNYTLPEGLELGEFVQSSAPTDLNNYNSGTYICIQASELIPEITFDSVTKNKIVNGIYQGCYFMIFTESDLASNMIEIYDKKGKGGAIVAVFLVPKAFAIGSVTTAIAGTAEGLSYAFLVPTSSSTYNTLVEDATFSRNTSLDGYTPKNKKLLTYPFNYFNLSNNSGSNVTMRYEDFASGTPHFKIIGDLTTGCSIKCVPLNYKKVTDSSGSMKSFDYGLVGGKYPTCSWNSDAYTNWLTQNSVNNALQTAQGATQTMLGMATFNPMMIQNGINGIVDVMRQKHNASFMPDQAKGNISCGDIVYSSGKNVFTAYKLCVRNEVAHSIDEFFTRFGYQVNRVKVPNITGRTYWNYVKIGTGEDIGNGDVPNKFKDTLNQIFRNGTTIWHSHDNIGNFNLNNTIVS